jgi:Exocyst complex component Sec10-like, alpha-helical bundle
VVACGIIQAVHRLFKANFDGINLTNELEEFGLRCYDLLVSHCKKHVVSQGFGALQLLRDLTEFRDVAHKYLCTLDDGGLALAEVADRFETIREIANLHLVAPENMRAVWQESRLSVFSRQEIHQLVAARSDFKTAWKTKYLHD